VSESRFVRWAAVVGDLGSPFFEEERQRDVWNEASQVGFQVMLWLNMLGAAAALWIGGEAAFPYALAMLLVAGAGSLVTLTYAQRLGVVPVAWRWLSKGGRLVAVVVLVLLVVSGLLHATWGDPSRRDGMAVGMLVGAALGALGLWRGLRAVRATTEDEDDEGSR
jgi:hypothetical protein